MNGCKMCLLLSPCTAERRLLALACFVLFDDQLTRN